ncbi:YjjG family noncanonical pyrimidine nucleotidase [Ilumatobacter sp.]|uniref:YjjG family noncanonical pyrimidine nucleotidase n=1 Tax=Ilumatobacter sp. TaxID=1967498 RepID=UPI003C4DBFC9
MNYPTVLFDLDHTLFDTHASEAAAFEATMRSIAVDPTPEVFAAYDRLNQALWRRVERGELDPNDVKMIRFVQLLDELGIDGDARAIAESFVTGLAEHGDLYAGAGELLAELGATCRLALITNGIGSVQRGRLRRLGLQSSFEVVSISGELGMTKPGREIFDHTLRAMEIDDRGGVVMIGDSLASDIRGGVNSGIDTIWFNPRSQTNTSEIAPTHEVSSLEDLAVLIG